MDYRKTNAPTTTVTRDLMELCEDTGNIYETVAIMASEPTRSVWKSRTICRRSWLNLLPTTTTWKRCSRTVSR